MRVIPTFSFKPERAEDLDARMTVEISGCENCNTWTLDIHDGHLHPPQRRSERRGSPQDQHQVSSASSVANSPRS